MPTAASSSAAADPGSGIAPQEADRADAAMSRRSVISDISVATSLPSLVNVHFRPLMMAARLNLHGETGGAMFVYKS